ncbi:hypothetical protein LXA43DRAFT_1065412 [Ganoderma leucocontextum]|nr:hypothetical protein LXA43DRAFT_1065412 [Ganoderma leucocontextum]
MSNKPMRHNSSGKVCPCHLHQETCSPEFLANPQASKRHHPYHDAKRPQARCRFGQANKESTSFRPSPAAPSHSEAPPEATVRETFMEVIREKHPHFKPRTDFDIYTLASTEYKGLPSGLYTWLDGQLALRLATSGDFDRIMNMTRQLLDSRGTITGRKPKLGAPNVFLRPIPNSQYSVRLFPGSLARQPVNSPFKFELWVLPNTSTPWLGGLPMRIHSLERVYGYRETDISSGAEKFLLRDGQTCMLKRSGHRDLRFTVPVRAAVLQPADVNADQLHFPEVV